MTPESQKKLGAFYTPDSVARTLVNWCIRNREDRLLDPSCGDGGFIVHHNNSWGIDKDELAVHTAKQRAPNASILHANFFDWVEKTTERFDCTAGNPPFIRYQRFKGSERQQALRVARILGVNLSGLSSSWAPFIISASSVLNRGGRMAFLIPAEIGHAPYATPILQYLMNQFRLVQIVAIREKIFPHLSEDVWLLYVEGYGNQTDYILFNRLKTFPCSDKPPRARISISRTDLKKWGGRLRPFLAGKDVRDTYEKLSKRSDVVTLGDIAKVGIGYVTGGNDFFHLRPSEVAQWGIESKYLHPSVRNGRFLPHRSVNYHTIQKWQKDDEEYLLLRINKNQSLTRSVLAYLNSKEGKEVRLSYKCRTRNPWYIVPSVVIPDCFLTYMSGEGARLVTNPAKCVCTNSLHTIELKKGTSTFTLLESWKDPFTILSCEIEGHPLGGGLLKLEPKEAQRVHLLLNSRSEPVDMAQLKRGIETFRKWRHLSESLE